MQSLRKLCVTFLCFSLLGFVTLSEATDPTYIYHICDNATSFTINSTYQSNLNKLLFSLNSTNTNGYTNGFYNATAGTGNSAVNGLFLCRGDVSASTCRDCVSFASTDVINRCPVEKEVLIWYYECMLRYSNESFFSQMSSFPAVYLSNTQNVTQLDSFNTVLSETMSTLATKASSNRRRFATKKANFTLFQSLYSLGQCTQDITESDCYSCLQQGIAKLPSCCGGKQGGRVLSPSCNIRYEIYSFYNETATASPSPPPSLVAVPAPSPPPPAAASKGGSRISKTTIIAIVVPITISAVLFTAGCCFLKRRGKKRYYVTAHEETSVYISSADSLQFDFGSIEAATSGFSENNKIGEGGFGQVYKGTLPSGQEIAVKRLSKSSNQGVREFKNEIALVARLQHRNLVRLLGFCFEGVEKILVYEFVPNKSLDYFLFDPEKQGLLDWSRRYKIIEGIAKGILYLHQDSQLRIIHRDLKASNILLDGDMNPKVSDFGLARTFMVDQTQGNTNRVVGTYGYMSPEYAMHGQFSVKSDVFSFGALVLEIITGQKNSSFSQTDGDSDLLSYSWKHWRNGTTIELVDPSLVDSYSRNEVMRCVHIALLSVQEDPADRPTMATIVLMLNSYSVTLPVPNKPAFCFNTRTESYEKFKALESDPSTSRSIPFSVNDDPITEVYPR